jgi:hypothetical protein
VLRPLVDKAKGHGWDVRLWALDEIHSALGSCTRGAGPGPKFSLLNSLFLGSEVHVFDWIVVVDDDVLIEQGSLALLLSIAERARLALVQPAHGDLSHRSHAITLWTPLAVARLTTFVEIGPIFAVHRSWSSRILPFPSGVGMGWGLDLQWPDLIQEGARLGIIDLVTIRHTLPPAGQYDIADETSRVDRLLRDRGLPSYEAMQRTLAVWRPWQRHAPWLLVQATNQA